MNHASAICRILEVAPRTTCDALASGIIGKVRTVEAAASHVAGTIVRESVVVSWTDCHAERNCHVGVVSPIFASFDASSLTHVAVSTSRAS